MHPHHLTGVVNGDIKPRCSMSFKFLTETIFITDQNNRNTKLTGCSNSTLNLNGRGVVTSHGFNSNSHGMQVRPE